MRPISEMLFKKRTHAQYFEHFLRTTSAKIFHIPFITATEGLKLYAVVQRTAKPDDDPTKNHPGVKVYRLTEELLKDGSVDLVIVGTTPASHYEIAKAALESGKHGYHAYLQCVNGD